jgi:hypothetical protein
MNLVRSLRNRTVRGWAIRQNIIGPFRKKDADRELGLSMARDWLLRAHDACRGGGVSTGYDLREGWLPAFPETTGYIIPTFFNLHRYYRDESLRRRALAMLDWLGTVQNPDGSISAVMPEFQKPVVFDTGQALFGWLRGAMETGGAEYRERAGRAAAWLSENQDADGKWSRHEFMDRPHVYNTRVAWALIEYGLFAKDGTAVNAGIRNVEWALSRQDPDGWYAQNEFASGEPTFTHTIAYATRGILESGLRLDRPGWVEAAKTAADGLLGRQQSDGRLAGSFGRGWEATSRSSCLTGNAQAVILWMRLHGLTGDRRYLEASDRALAFLLARQERSRILPPIHGAIAGSFPIDGTYLAWVYPNWAAKFFCDALLLSLDASGSVFDEVLRNRFY